MSVPSVSRREVVKSLEHIETQIKKSKKCDPTVLPDLFSKIQQISDNKQLSKDFQKLAKKSIELYLSQEKSHDIHSIFSLSKTVKLIEKEKTRKKLSQQIERAANKVLSKPSTTKDFSASVSADSIRPLVGKPIELAELAKEYRKGNNQIKTGLEQLGPFFSMRRIAGDGHCLFRSTLVGLIHYLKQSPERDVTNFYHQLDKSVEELKDVCPEIEKKYTKGLESIKAILSNKKSIEDVLNDRPSSDLLVSLLRDLVCAYNFMNGDEVFDSETVVFSGNQENYLTTMMDMSKNELGGHPEILALNSILDIELIPVNVAAVTSNTETAESYLERALQAKKIPIFLLFRPGHYDIAFPKV